MQDKVEKEQIALPDCIGFLETLICTASLSVLVKIFLLIFNAITMWDEPCKVSSSLSSQMSSLVQYVSEIHIRGSACQDAKSI